jgi:hypothetical protein
MMSDTGADARVLATERNAARVRPQRGIAEYGVTVGGVHALAGGT